MSADVVPGDSGVELVGREILRLGDQLEVVRLDDQVQEAFFVHIEQLHAET